MTAWLNDVKAECKSANGPLAGLDLYINETLRTFRRSDDLYALGRTVKGSIVTNAAAGQSIHNYGLAIDVYPMRGGKPIFNFDLDPKLMKAMARVAELAAKHGIEWGGHWTKLRDLPHFQIADAPNWRELKKKYPKGWVPGVSHEA